MRIEIEKSIAKGDINAPPSKSYAHRLLICGALSRGESKINGVSESVDMVATLDCISALGAVYTKKGDQVSINGGINPQEEAVYNCYESGSTLRFFIPLALACGGKSKFIGTERLMSRGLEVYEEIFKKQNIEYKKEKTALYLNGKLKPDTFYVRGDISSQFISGLLFALPLLEGDSIIKLTTGLESCAYVDITIETLRSFGIKIERKNNDFYIKGNQKYIPTEICAEGDMSNSAFLDAFNLLGGDVSVKGLNENTIQADKIYQRLFNELKNGMPTIDLTNCPDLGPIAFALAGALNGADFVGTKRLKIKESDRVEAMATELKKLGVTVEVYENSAKVYGKMRKPNEILYGHNDHRIVMALAVILSKYGGIIDGCEAVSKSYPDFFEEIGGLGVKCRAVEVKQ